jgi:hypothetical protein
MASTDETGNIFVVERGQPTLPIKLHAFADGTVEGTGDKGQGAREVTATISVRDFFDREVLRQTGQVRSACCQKHRQDSQFASGQVRVLQGSSDDTRKSKLLPAPSLRCHQALPSQRLPVGHEPRLSLAVPVTVGSSRWNFVVAGLVSAVANSATET